MSKRSIYIICIVVALAALAEIACVAFGGTTISDLITDVSYKLPIVPFAFGLLMGHWFWNRKKGE